jgi:CRISPR system Cascade subunit CasC
VNPTGKQNSFAAHNHPDGIAVELKGVPCSYANAFVKPVEREQRGLIE